MLQETRTVPVGGRHPDASSEYKVWHCQLTWRTVGQEVEMSIYCPFGIITRRAPSAFDAQVLLRLEELEPRMWGLATRGARIDVWNIAVTDPFPGTRAEILVPGQHPRNLETVDIFELEGNVDKLWPVSKQAAHYEAYLTEWEQRSARGQW